LEYTFGLSLRERSKMADRLAELEVQFSLDPNDKETWDHTAVNIYRPDFEFPKEYAKYLPESTQYVLKELDYLIPHNEALGLIKEAQVQRYSMARKLNDPHSRGYHEGDPERISRTSLSDSPIEDRGRRYASADQYFESTPNVYRAALPHSPIMTRKYAFPSSPKGRSAGSAVNAGYIPSFDDNGEIAEQDTVPQGRNRYGDGPQISRYGSDYNGMYQRVPPQALRQGFAGADQMILERDASPGTEQHEAIHRGLSSIPMDVRRLDSTSGQPSKKDIDHDYIRDVEIGRSDMSEYDYLLEALRSSIFKSEE